MRIQLFFFFTLFLSCSVLGQSKVQWGYSFDAENNTVEIKATIAEGWHLYSQHVDNEIGPVPTSIVFESNPQVKMVGKVTEPTPIQKYDENFEAMLDFFEDEVLFEQRVSVKKSTVLNGTLTYMVCNDTMCLPPVDEKFTIELKK